ncbi:PDZ domain-containing protein [Sporosarcina thermotolerans]|uniref:PDZ domain-containing protein n=1 Tax=Sporosarcina thermotolerans TaxID=633404 RepID=UPI0024BCC6E5|nr:PDZ domain-containing protein [Sporosarcina thermotolerans]WHT48495.1 PDZ domain-containing protein [Sporosarcina thermotolerans]
MVKVQPNTPADGLINDGDIITNVNGIQTDSYDELEIIVSETEPDKPITLTVMRDGQQLEVELMTVPYGQTVQ